MPTDRPWLIKAIRANRPVVVILGPTAVGKTHIALQVAQTFSAEIVSVDSRLLYLGMDIGTAKPTPVERSMVPHHLIDVTTPDQIWSLAQYQAAASQAIHSIHHRDRLPVLVGGTGQYVHALTQGWEIPPVAPHPGIRLALEKWASHIGSFPLHQRLAHLDPSAAAAIDPSNVRRTIRALEVIFTTGRLFSAQKRRLAPPYTILKIGLTRPRPELYQRIDQRIDQMLQDGFVAEVQGLLARGYSHQLPTLSAIGYSEIAAYLRGDSTLEEAITLMKRRTRIFVRRQANWFKPNDPSIRWFAVGDNTAVQLDHFISTWLSTLTTTADPHPKSRS